jgi:uncharacterized protein YraI
MLRHKRWMWMECAAVLVLALLVGCGGNGKPEPTAVSDAQPPTVNILTPSDQALLPAGQAVQISITAIDDRAIARLELYVDNSLIESRVAPAGSVLTTMSEQFAWSASIVGSHTLQARAYDSTGQMGASRIVGVQVQIPGAATAAPGGSPQPQPTSAPTEVAPTPLPTAPPAPPTAELPMVRANLNANVRSGPGTNYPVVGSMAGGEGAMVTGRNLDSSWWQISFQGGTAWIANSVVTANAAAATAPVVSAPPPPATNTPVPPTPTPTPLAPTNTPAPTSGFWVDHATLNAGQCTTLRWNFQNINAIHISFGYGYDKEPQPGVGTRQVCPSITTEYVAQVTKQDNSIENNKVTVTVSGAGGGDPAIKKFDPTTLEVAANTPFSIFWEVDYAKAVWYIKGNGAEQAVGGYGSKVDETITAETVFKLKVEKNSGGFVYKSFTVKLKP